MSFIDQPHRTTPFSVHRFTAAAAELIAATAIVVVTSYFITESKLAVKRSVESLDMFRYRAGLRDAVLIETQRVPDDGCCDKAGKWQGVGQ